MTSESRCSASTGRKRHQTHLRDAEAFDRIADSMLQADRAAKAAGHGYAGPPGQSRLAADKEAGQ